MNPWIITAIWVVGTIWAHRHIVKWIDLVECFTPIDDGEDAVMFAIMCAVALVFAAIAWPLILVGVPAIAFGKHLWGATPDLRRWVRWLYATSREERKEALRK